MTAPHVMPLTPQQRGVYFLHCLAPDSAVYNVPIVMRVTGALDRGRLQRAVDVLRDRHQALRLTVRERDGDVRQFIPPVGGGAPVTVGWHAADGPDPDAVAEQAVRFTAQAFDLANGPLWRVDVIDLGEDRYALAFAFHHIIIDEVSAAVLAKELDRAYGDATDLDASDEYVEFCTELSAATDPKALDWWRHRLAGLTTLRLPEEYVPTRHGLFVGDRVSFVIGAEVAARVEAVGRAHRVSEFMVFHAALAALMYRWTGANDVTIGTPMAGRTDRRYAETVGFFQNTVVLRTEVRPADAYADLLKASRRMVLEALQHQVTPFEAVVEAMRPARDAARNPLFQVALVFSRRKVEQDWTLPGLRVEPLPFRWRTSHFDLTLTMLHEYGVLKGDFAFSAQRFTRATVERLSAAFGILLESLTDDPGTTIGDATLLDPAEHDRIEQLVAASGRCVLDERGHPRPLGFFGAVHTVDPAGGTPVATGERGRYDALGQFEVWREPASAALATHPGVGEVTVVRADAVAYVAGHPDAPAPLAGELLDFLRTRLPGYLLPGRVVVLPALTRTPDGHYDLDALAADAARYSDVGTEPDDGDDAARDATEAALIGLFEELLGIPGIGRGDNFFDYGGHSLLAVRLVGRIAEDLGQTVGVGAVMNNPTPAALAATLTRDATTGSGGVVRLRATTDGDTTVALIHPVGGTLLCYRELMARLPGDIEVVGQERVVGAHPRDDDYPAMIERYATALAEAVPYRRLVIVGWSLGGVLAHSVAARLAEMGRSVALVAMLDSLAVRTPADRERMADTSAQMYALVDDVRRLGTDAIGTTADQQLLMRRFGVQLDALRETPPERAAEMMADWGELLRLVSQCHPTPVTVPTHLFLCADNPPGYPEAILASWDGLCAELEHSPIPGDHTQALDATAVAEVAPKLTVGMTAP